MEMSAMRAAIVNEHPDVATVFFDESGYTGDDLLQANQPVFVSASTIAEAAEAQNLLDTTIGPLNRGAKEHKHGRLVRTGDGQGRIVALIRELAKTPAKAAYYTIFKRFALVAKLVDNWIEPAMHERGFNLYENGGARALANMLYACGPVFEGEERFENLLRIYQTFSRDLTMNGFTTFLDKLKELYASKRRPESEELYGYPLIALHILGPEHMESLKLARANDIAYPAVFSSFAHWDTALDAAFDVIHDRSTNIARVKNVFDAVTSVTLEQVTVAFDARLSYRLPFRATGLRFGESETYAQLQVCDLLAGAAAACGQWCLDQTHHPDYVRALIDAGIETLSIGFIRPDIDDIAGAGPVAPGAADPLAVMARLLHAADTK